MRTRGRSVSIPGGGAPPAAAAARFSSDRCPGAPGGASASAHREEAGQPSVALEISSTPATPAPEHEASSAAPRLRRRHGASADGVIVRIDEARGEDAFPSKSPVRLHHANGSPEDALLRTTDQCEAYEIRCGEMPVAGSVDPDDALDGVIATEVGL